MTDKQIIIDGVDVSGCEFYCEQHCKQVLDEDGCYVFLCAEDKNCHYKNWQRKEQECEELKNDSHTLLVTRQKLLNDLWIAEESLKDFKEICDKQCEQLEAYKMEAEEGKEINAELKAELTRTNCQIADDEILQCDMREAIEKLTADLEQEKALKETYLACYKAKHEDIEGKLFKLSKTLTEIKEIAQYNVYTSSTDLCLKLNWIKKKISEVEDGI